MPRTLLTERAAKNLCYYSAAMVWDEAAEQQKLEAKGEAEVRKWLANTPTRDKRTALAQSWLETRERKRNAQRYWITVAVAVTAVGVSVLALLQ